MATQDQRPSHAFGVVAKPAARLTPGPAPAQQSDEVGRPLYCPECGMPTWVEWRDGDHVKVRCFSRHWFLMLDERLD